MTVGQFLTSTPKTLAQAGIDTARLDCLVLLEDALGKDRAILLAHPETSIPDQQFAQLNNFITQRLNHTPLAYIRGKVEFYGREFLVNNHVLVPRPETEAMIDLLKNITLPSRPHIADVGTGTGCIGITAAVELPNAEVFLYDIDQAALRVAAKNIQHFQTISPTGTIKRVHLDQRDLLADAIEQFDVIVANLPYVPKGYKINKAARHEPKLAIFAGADGLELYRRLWEQIAILPRKPKHVLTESLPEQHQSLGQIAKSAGFELKGAQGYIQYFAS
jgi:release factor glutamine methyltransferase